ncbi:MAG: ATP-binding protein [Lachnospiraceae bacterium]|nr:ATP-binding protein [Lachnospiraceae bacterium]
MKLLRVCASNFKNCQEKIVIDFVAKSKKTSEDKQYELVKVADELYVYSTAAFIGKNASGKTTAIEILDCCYSILGEFRVENKHYNYDGISLEIIFYHEGNIYKYTTKLQTDSVLENRAVFRRQHVYCKKYYKTKLNSIYYVEGFEEIYAPGALPDDTASIFFILKKNKTTALYFDSCGEGVDTYQLLFKVMKNYQIPDKILNNIIRIFDESIQYLQKVDDHNYRISVDGKSRIYSDKELIYMLSSGTTKGILLYMMMAASLQNGFDLLVDEIETHFHKTLVENMINLYKDKTVNKKNATLIFTTHYCEVLDLFNRQDNLWICQSNGKIQIRNLYDNYGLRSGLLKSKQFYNNTFQTAVNYEELMNLKRGLMS